MEGPELYGKLVGEVFDITIDKLDIKKEGLTIESHFVDDLGADSLDLVELLMGFEEKYNINIPDEENENLLTIKKVLSYMVDHVDGYKDLKSYI